MESLWKAAQAAWQWLTNRRSQAAQKSPGPVSVTAEAPQPSPLLQDPPTPLDPPWACAYEMEQVDLTAAAADAAIIAHQNAVEALQICLDGLPPAMVSQAELMTQQRRSSEIRQAFGLIFAHLGNLKRIVKRQKDVQSK